jgi:hypothetical protein
MPSQRYPGLSQLPRLGLRTQRPSVATAISRRRQPRGRVLLVIPAFNEVCGIEAVMQTARGLKYDVCVIDNRSADRMADSVTDAGAHVLRLPVNLGVGAALRCGFR